MFCCPTRGHTYAVVANVARVLDVEPVDVFLEQAEQWEVEGGQSGLLALECFTFHSVITCYKMTPRPTSSHHHHHHHPIFHTGPTHFGSVAVVKRVLYHQPFEHLDGNVADFPELLEGATHLPHQQPHQEVVAAEIVGEGVVQLKVCGRKEGDNLGNK